MAAKLTILTHKIVIQLPPSGRELYHLQFSLQAASPETFGYTLLILVLFDRCETTLHSPPLTLSYLLKIHL